MYYSPDKAEQKTLIQIRQKKRHKKQKFHGRPNTVVSPDKAYSNIKSIQEDKGVNFTTEETEL
jgi:hypothetical protein